MDFIIYLILLIEVVLFTTCDKKFYGTWLTPFSVISIPYLTILTLILCFGEKLELHPFYYPSIWVWICGLGIFGISGSLVTRIFYKKRVSEYINSPMYGEHGGERILTVLAVICVTGSAYGFFRSSSGQGLQALSSPDFVDAYGAGWPAHLRVISYSIFMYYVGTKAYQKWHNMILLLLIFVFIALGTGKSWLMIPLVTGIMYQMVTRKLNFNIKRLSQVVLGLFVIFNIAYLIRFGSADSSAFFDIEVYQFLFKHFFNYLSSGIMGLSEQFRLGMEIPDADWRVVFAPIINIISIITGNRFVYGVTEYWISTGVNMETNVHTIFGTLYIHLGLWWSILYVTCLGIFVNVFYSFALMRRNSWILIAALFELGLLAFGWFDNYSGNLAFVEVPFWTGILFLSSKIQSGNGSITIYKNTSKLNC